VQVAFAPQNSNEPAPVQPKDFDLKRLHFFFFDWNGRSSAFMHLDRGKNPCLHEKYSGQKGKKTPA
jgi:hypothetical protein